MNKFPSAKTIIEEAQKINPKADINNLHALTYELIKGYRNIYYKDKIKDLLDRPSLIHFSEKVKSIFREELFRPIQVKDKIYSNFMEESSRRISQTLQTISGNLAELCVERELVNIGLKKDINYKRKTEHTDLIIYYPRLPNFSKKHRIEVKNVKLRERGTRGFAFDGDSMLGFFDEASEFTDENIEILNSQCKKTGGFCYLPPSTFKQLKNKLKNKRFRSNKDFAIDIMKFVETGVI